MSVQMICFILILFLLNTGYCDIFYGKLVLKVSATNKRNPIFSHRPTVFATRRSTYLKKDGDVFKIHIPGIARNASRDTISFESVRWPGYYLRHKRTPTEHTFRIAKPTGLENNFNSESTFLIQRHTGIEGSGMLKLYGEPAYYLCVRKYNYGDSALKAMKNDHTDDFKKRCSFFIQKLKPENVNAAVRKSTQDTAVTKTIQNLKTKPVTNGQPVKSGVAKNGPIGGNDLVSKMLKEYVRKIENEQKDLMKKNIKAKPKPKNVPHNIKPISAKYVKNNRDKNHNLIAVTRQNLREPENMNFFPPYNPYTMNRFSNPYMSQQQQNMLSFFPVVARYNPTTQYIKSFFNKGPSHVNTENNHPVEIGRIVSSGKNDIMKETQEEKQKSRNNVHSRNVYNHHTREIPLPKNKSHIILKETLQSKQRHQEPQLNLDGTPQNASITLTMSKLQTHKNVKKEGKHASKFEGLKLVHNKSVDHKNQDQMFHHTTNKMIRKVLGPSTKVSLHEFSKIHHREPSLNIDGLIQKVKLPDTRSDVANNKTHSADNKENEDQVIMKNKLSSVHTSNPKTVLAKNHNDIMTFSEAPHDLKNKETLTTLARSHGLISESTHASHTPVKDDYEKDDSEKNAKDMVNSSKKTLEQAILVNPSPENDKLFKDKVLVPKHIEEHHSPSTIVNEQTRNSTDNTETSPSSDVKLTTSNENSSSSDDKSTATGEKSLTSDDKIMDADIENDNGSSDYEEKTKENFTPKKLKTENSKIRTPTKSIENKTDTTSKEEHYDDVNTKSGGEMTAFDVDTKEEGDQKNKMNIYERNKEAIEENEKENATDEKIEQAKKKLADDVPQQTTNGNSENKKVDEKTSTKESKAANANKNDAKVAKNSNDNEMNVGDASADDYISDSKTEKVQQDNSGAKDSKQVSQTAVEETSKEHYNKDEQTGSGMFEDSSEENPGNATKSNENNTSKLSHANNSQLKADNSKGNKTAIIITSAANNKGVKRVEGGKKNEGVGKTNDAKKQETNAKLVDKKQKSQQHANPKNEEKKTVKSESKIKMTDELRPQQKNATIQSVREENNVTTIVESDNSSNTSDINAANETSGNQDNKTVEPENKTVSENKQNKSSSQPNKQIIEKTSSKTVNATNSVKEPGNKPDISQNKNKTVNPGKVEFNTNTNMVYDEVQSSSPVVYDEKNENSDSNFEEEGIDNELSDSDNFDSSAKSPTVESQKTSETSNNIEGEKVLDSGGEKFAESEKVDEPSSVNNPLSEEETVGTPYNEEKVDENGEKLISNSHHSKDQKMIETGENIEEAPKINEGSGKVDFKNDNPIATIAEILKNDKPPGFHPDNGIFYSNNGKASNLKDLGSSEMDGIAKAMSKVHIKDVQLLKSKMKDLDMIDVDGNNNNFAANGNLEKGRIMNEIGANYAPNTMKGVQEFKSMRSKELSTPKETSPLYDAHQVQTNAPIEAEPDILENARASALLEAKKYMDNGNISPPQINSNLEDTLEKEASESTNINDQMKIISSQPPSGDILSQAMTQPGTENLIDKPSSADVNLNAQVNRNQFQIPETASAVQSSLPENIPQNINAGEVASSQSAPTTLESLQAKLREIGDQVEEQDSLDSSSKERAFINNLQDEMFSPDLRTLKKSKASSKKSGKTTQHHLVPQKQITVKGIAKNTVLKVPIPVSFFRKQPEERQSHTVENSISDEDAASIIDELKRKSDFIRNQPEKPYTRATNDILPNLRSHKIVDTADLPNKDLDVKISNRQGVLKNSTMLSNQTEQRNLAETAKDNTGNDKTDTDTTSDTLDNFVSSKEAATEDSTESNEETSKEISNQQETGTERENENGNEPPKQTDRTGEEKSPVESNVDVKNDGKETFNVARHSHHLITVKDEAEKQRMVNGLVNFDSDRCISLQLINDLNSRYRLISSINNHGYTPRGKIFSLKTVFKDPFAHKFVKFHAIDEKNPHRKVLLNSQKERVATPESCSNKPTVVHVTSPDQVDNPAVTGSKKDTVFTELQQDEEDEIFKKNRIEHPDDLIIHRIGNDVRSITRIHTLHRNDEIQSRDTNKGKTSNDLSDI